MAGNAGFLADFGGDSPARNGPPKTILAPPPPPAPPPPATRSVKATLSAAGPGAGPGVGLGVGQGTLGPPPAPTRTPPGMGAPIVPQHRNEVLHKMLRGLEDDSLTVADVLGVLETELRSGAPAQAPLSEQFERYIGPLAEVAGPGQGFGPGSAASKTPPRNATPPRKGPGPLDSGAPLLGPAPNALAVPALGPGGGSYTPRKAAGGAPGFGRNGEDGPQHVIVNCARCAVLEQQLKALSQSLSGLGARMFNWSLAHCKDNAERNGMWHLIVKYLEPVMSVDGKIAETCSGLQAACGTTGGVHVPSESLQPGLSRRNRGNGPPTGAANGAQNRAGPGPVWQPPGIGASAAGALDAPGASRTARFAENPLHRAAVPGSPASPSSQASPTPGRLPPSALQMRAKAVVPEPRQFSPPTPASPSSPKRIDPEGFGPMAEEVTVRFGASRLAKKLNGVYEMVPGAKVNQRPVYVLGRRNILHLGDGTWAIKDGADDNVDADVYAYVKDAAREPHRVNAPWSVAADGDGFVVDTRGAVTPGRSDTVEAIDATSAKAARLAAETPTSGLRADIAVMDREEREELRQLRAAAQRRKQGGPTEEERSPRSEAAKAKPTEKKPARREPVPFQAAGPARLRIKIVSAQKLRNADAIGGSDPYVIVEVPGKGALGRSPVINNTQKPVWNHEIDTRYTLGDSLKFTVWDEDSMSKADYLNEALLKMDRFYPGGFRGELALKDGSKDTRATLAVEIDVLETPEQKPEPDAAEDKEPTSPLEPAGPSPELLELRRKLEAASAREKVLQQKLLDAEDAAQTAPTHWVDDYDYDDEDWDDHDDHEAQAPEDEEIQRFHEIFDKYDVDKSGTIAIPELCALMESLGAPTTEAEAALLLDKVDDDNDGVDFEEFLLLIDDLRRAEDSGKNAKYKAMFSKFDVNGDGSISTLEMSIVLDAMGTHLSQAEVDQLVEEIDQSGDGVIEYDEFITLIQQVLEGRTPKSKVVMDLTQVASAPAKPTLAPSDRKRIKAYLKRKGFPHSDEDDLFKAVNQQKKSGGYLGKKGFEFPLHVAADENLGDMVWLLLESKANPSEKNSSGHTPLEVAGNADNGKGSHQKVMDLIREAEEPTF